MNKGSDINVGSIEEYIKILENLKSYLKLLVYDGNDKIIYNDLLWDEKTVDCINTIEHLLSDYTRQKQINEEHQKENGLLREKVKELDTKNDELLKDLYSANCIISDLTDSIPKQVVKEKFEKIQSLYEKNLKEVDLKEVEKIDVKIFEGIRLEAQRDLVRELLQESEENKNM